MSVARKFVISGALAAVATLGLGATASASAAESDGHEFGKWKHDRGERSSLVNVDDNNVGPFQVCHNDVPVNVLGGQVPVDDVMGLLNLFGSDSLGNQTQLVKTCEQDSVQDN